MTTVKQGDTHNLTLTIGADLADATVRVLARRGSETVEELDASVTDEGGGVITHTLTGTLPPGDYRVEVEVTRDGVIQTAPTEGYARLTVLPDLG